MAHGATFDEIQKSRQNSKNRNFFVRKLAENRITAFFGLVERILLRGKNFGFSPLCDPQNDLKLAQN